MAKIESITQTNRYGEGDVSWYLGDSEGPLGRTARLRLDPPLLVKVTKTNDDTGEEYEVEEPQGRWARSATVTLYAPNAKQAAEIPGLRRYDAEQLAMRWVEDGR